MFYSHENTVKSSKMFIKMKMICLEIGNSFVVDLRKLLITID